MTKRPGPQAATPDRDCQQARRRNVRRKRIPVNRTTCRLPSANKRGSSSSLGTVEALASGFLGSLFRSFYAKRVVPFSFVVNTRLLNLCAPVGMDRGAARLPCFQVYAVSVLTKASRSMSVQVTILPTQEAAVFLTKPARNSLALVKAPERV